MCGPGAGGSRLPVPAPEVELIAPAPPLTPAGGQAGASALRNYERLSQRHHQLAEAEVGRDAAWRDRVKQDHPVLGRLASAATPRPTVRSEPKNVTAWRTGSHGEVRVAGILDDWAARAGAIALHDQMIAGSRANIDHLAIAPWGVWVVDAKEYTGPVTKVEVGGWFRTDSRLKVAGRDRTKLLEGLSWQMERAREALAHLSPGLTVPVWGALCFVGS